MEDYMYGHQAQANYGYVPTPTAPMDMSMSYPHPSHPYTSYQDQQPDLTRLLAQLSHPSQQQSISSMMGMPNPAISALLTTLMSQPQSTSSFTPTSTTTPSRPTPSNVPTNGIANGIPPPMKPVPSSSVPLPPTNGHLPTTIPKRRPKRGRSSTLTQEERLKSRRLKHRQLDADRRSRLAAGFDTLQELTANVTGLQTTKFSTSSQNGSQNGADSDSEWDDEEDGSGSDSKQGEKKKKKKSNPQANAATMKTDKASILILSSQVLYNLQQEVASLREQVERERRAAQADGDDDIDEVEIDTSTINNNNQQQQDNDYVQLPNLQCSMFLNAGMSMTCYDMDGRLVDCNQTFLNIHAWPSRDAVLGLPLMSAFFHDVLSNHVHNRHPHLMKHYINQPSTNPFYQKTVTYSSPIVAARFAQPPTQEEINKLGPPTAYYPSTALDYRRLFNGEEQVITTTDRLYDGEGHLYEEKCTSWLVYEQDRPMYLVGYAQKDTCLRLT